MSLRILGLAMAAGLVALAAVTGVQGTPQTFTVAQATAPVGTPDAAAKSKAKKPKKSGSGNSGSGTSQPAPTGGPPDPGKYM
jgi:hypothetical protein